MELHLNFSNVVDLTKAADFLEAQGLYFEVVDRSLVFEVKDSWDANNTEIYITSSLNEEGINFGYFELLQS